MISEAFDVFMAAMVGAPNSIVKAHLSRSGLGSPNMSTLADRIEELITEKGCSPADVARAARVKPPSVAAWRSGATKSLKGETVARLVDFFSVNPHWLTRGVGPKRLDTGHIVPFGDEPRMDNAAIMIPNGVVIVPRYHNHASLGPGAELLSEDALADEIQLQREWLERHLHPCPPWERLAFITAWGDSMSPTIKAGNILLIDIGTSSVEVPGIYLIRAGGRLFVKRISFPLAGAPVVSSDNPAEKQVDVLDGKAPIEIAGRVLYAWKGEAL